MMMKDTRTIISYLMFGICCGNHLSQGQMISLTSKPQSGSIMWGFTRELDKESLLN